MADLRLACLCPTYKRPGCLANVAACFMQQTYPAHLRKLFILDDVSQYADEVIDSCPTTGEIHVVVHNSRYRHLPAKFDQLARIATTRWQPDILVVWEDDDIFLPHHLDSIAAAVQDNTDPLLYCISENVFSTYNQPKGKTIIEGASGRFHSSWAFTTALYDRVGGYPDTPRLDFDQQLGRVLGEVGRTVFYSRSPAADGRTWPLPSYVYRWGNGIYHGSQAGEDNYNWLYNQHLPQLTAPYVGRLIPEMDEETELIYKAHQCSGLTV